MRKKLNYFVILAIILVFLYSFGKGFFERERVEAGDFVEIDYVGFDEEGKIFDATMRYQTYPFRKSPYFVKKSVYKPLVFEVLKGEYPYFEREVLGMKVGEEKEIKVPPKTKLDKSLILEVSLYQTMPKIFEWSLEIFRDIAMTNPEVGLTFSAGGVSFRVKEVRENTVVLEKEVEEGEIVLTPYGYGKVKEVFEEEFTVVLVSEVGDVVRHSFENKVKIGRVIKKTSSTLVIDFNPPLAGQTLTYIIYLRKILTSEVPQSTINQPPKNYVSYDNIEWIWNDISYALELAKRENKLVLVDFWASWCSWCIKMDREVYPDYKVEEIIFKSYIAVKIDDDRFPELSREYGISGLPTVVILNKNGEEIGRISGFVPAYEFAAKLKKYAEGLYQIL